jgi:cell division septal protein FtsQ
MAYLNPPFKFPAAAAHVKMRKFQRGREKAQVRKIQRKLTVKFKHIFLFFFLLGAIFYSIFKLYLYLITCDDLQVKQTSILCQRDFVRQDIQSLLDASKLGNLFLLDIRRLQDRIEDHRWVKAARVRKSFPSSLKIEVRERVPAAVLEVGSSFILVDEEGAYLERLAAREDADLPLLRDSGSFRTRYQEKLDLAWACLKSLTAEEISGLAALDLSRNASVSVDFRDLPTRLVLGDSGFADKLRFFQSYRERLESEHGPLEYVDLSFDDRIYIKPLPTMASAALNKPGKGVE